MNAFDKIMNRPAELTYADIAELRAQVAAAGALRDQLQREDAQIELLFGGPVIFETVDGLQCRVGGEVFAPGQLLPEVARQVVDKPDQLGAAVSPTFKPRAVRRYRFLRFVGSPRHRCALYREVVE